MQRVETRHGAGEQRCQGVVAHRLSFGIGILAAECAVVLAVVSSHDRRGLFLALGVVLGSVLLLGAGVGYDLLERNRSFGGDAVALALVAATAVAAWSQADDVRRFYQFADSASFRGLEHLSRALRPGKVVATERRWSFLGTWLLHTRTLPALDPADIQPKAELPFARRAGAVLEGRRAVGPSRDGSPSGMRSWIQRAPMPTARPPIRRGSAAPYT